MTITTPSKKGSKNIYSHVRFSTNTARHYRRIVNLNFLIMYINILQHDPKLSHRKTEKSTKI